MSDDARCLIEAQREAFKAGARVRYNKGFRFTDKALQAEAEKLFPWPAYPEKEIWTTSNGVRVHISHMDDEHLENTINFIDRYLTRGADWAEKREMMKKEVIRRKMYIPYHCPCHYCEMRRRAR